MHSVSLNIESRNKTYHDYKGDGSDKTPYEMIVHS